MAFRIPQFNLSCNIWHNPTIPPMGLPDLPNVPCQLTVDGHLIGTFAGGFLPILMPLIKVQAGTDVRMAGMTGGGDAIECPAGSARYYHVWTVEDVAKGFPNEYRLALVTMQAPPTPLP
jgi:hypothetical protein